MSLIFFKARLNKSYGVTSVFLTYLILLLALVSSQQLYAEQDVVLNGEQAALQQRPQVLELQSTIVGNQEQPEVIYIVPWQQIEAPAPSYQPMQQIVDGQFDLLDRDEWRRKVDLQKALEMKRSK